MFKDIALDPPHLYKKYWFIVWSEYPIVVSGIVCKNNVFMLDYPLEVTGKLTY